MAMFAVGAVVSLAAGCGARAHAPAEPGGADASATSIDRALLLGAWSGEYVVTKVEGTTRSPFSLVFGADGTVVMGKEEPPRVGRYWLRGDKIVLRGPGDEVDFELVGVKLTAGSLRARADIPALGKLFPESFVDLTRAE